MNDNSWRSKLTAAVSNAVLSLIRKINESTDLQLKNSFRILFPDGFEVGSNVVPVITWSDGLKKYVKFADVQIYVFSDFTIDDPVNIVITDEIEVVEDIDALTGESSESEADLGNLFKFFGEFFDSCTDIVKSIDISTPQVSSSVPVFAGTSGGTMSTTPQRSYSTGAGGVRAQVRSVSDGESSALAEARALLIANSPPWWISTSYELRKSYIDKMAKQFLGMKSNNPGMTAKDYWNYIEKQFKENGYMKNVCAMGISKGGIELDSQGICALSKQCGKYLPVAGGKCKFQRVALSTQ